jgi:hypothetical protein
MLGWTVLNSLKLDPRPVTFPYKCCPLRRSATWAVAGAFNYLIKPATTGELEHAFDRLND